MTAGLDDRHSQTVSLTREEAILAIGFVEAAVDRIEREADPTHDPLR